MQVARDEPPSTRTEQVYLTLGSAFLAGAVALFLADTTTAFDAPFGLYPILACLAIGGGCGWQVGAGRRELREVRREQQQENLRHRAQLAELISEVRELRAAARTWTVAPRPVGRAAVAGVQESTAVVPRVDDKMRATWRAELADRDVYWRVYTDVLEDLGGLGDDGHASN